MQSFLGEIETGVTCLILASIPTVPLGKLTPVSLKATLVVTLDLRPGSKVNTLLELRFALNLGTTSSSLLVTCGKVIQFRVTRSGQQEIINNLLVPKLEGAIIYMDLLLKLQVRTLRLTIALPLGK